MTCYLPWTQAFVNANGVTSPCCAPLELGNLNDQGFGPIFHGQGFSRLRQDLAAGASTEATRFCEGCYTRRKLEESGATFDSAHRLGQSKDASLEALHVTHPAFARNYEAIRTAYLERRQPPPDAHPLRLEVQLGEHCNIRCIMCWQDHSKPRALNGWSFDEIEAALPYVTSFLVTGGEPTIFKEFWRLVEVFKEVAMPAAELHVLTHGQQLRTELHRFRGIKHLALAVNVDGPTRESYEHIRSGAKWDVLNESLAMVQAERRNQPHWQLNTTFLLMRSNLDLIEESIEFAERYGADWGCGMIAGEHSPVSQCRTYLMENVFRFPHEGYSREEIVARLEAALPRARQHPSDMAAANLMATIEQTRHMDRLDITPEVMTELMGLNSLKELSNRIRDIAVESGAAAVARASAAGLKASPGPGEPPPGAVAGLTTAHSLARELLSQGRTALATGDTDIAVEPLKQAVRTLGRVRDASAEDLALARLDLARAMANGSDARKAVPVYRRAWNELKACFGPSHSVTAMAALELGQLLNRFGRQPYALAPLHAAESAFRRLYGRQDDLSFGAVAAAELGKAMLAVGDPTAEAQLRRAREAMTDYCGEFSSNTAYVVYDLAQALKAAGRRREVRKLLETYLERQLETFQETDLLPGMTRFWLWKLEAEAA